MSTLRLLAIQSLLSVLCAACGGAAPRGATTATGTSHGGGGSAHPHRADSHEIGAPTDRDRVPHPHWTTDQYVARLEDPARDQWQMPARLVEALAIAPGMRVADVGTGSGYFLSHLSRAVGAGGHVVGEDIDAGLLEHARRRVEHERLGNVELRRGEPADVGLEPGRYDLVLVVDTYHHVVDRPAWLASIGRALVPGTGRFVLVEFRDGPLPVGPPPEHKILRVRVERELRSAGFVLAREHAFLTYQYAIELMRPGAAPEPRPPTTEAHRSDEQPSVVLDDDMTPTDGGFPALSADHARVALAISDPDGLRASPNLLVRIVRLTGGAREDYSILSVAEGVRYEARDPSASQRREVQGRLARATAALMAGDFRAMAAIALPRGVPVAPVEAVSHGLRLAYDPATRTLSVSDVGTGRSRFSTVLEIVPERRAHASCTEHVPYLGGAWADAAAGVLVLRVAYAGTDTCGAPAPLDRVERLQ